MFETWETNATIVISEDWDTFHPQTVTKEGTGDEFAETMAEVQVPYGDGTAEVLLPGSEEGSKEVINGVLVLVPGSDEGGEYVISGILVLVPGLTKAFHADCLAEEDVGSDRNPLLSLMVAEPNAKKEEEESSSYVEDVVDTPTNHRSLVHEEDTSSSVEISLADEEEASTATEVS